MYIIFNSLNNYLENIFKPGCTEKEYKNDNGEADSHESIQMYSQALGLWCTFEALDLHKSMYIFNKYCTHIAFHFDCFGPQNYT